jgi:hypothetical protein
MQPVVLAVTADHHPGSALAICPPEGVPLDDGGTYMPSKEQVWLWDHWANSFWPEAVRVKEEYDAKLYNILNGDLFEGEHHGSTQTLNPNPIVEKHAARRVFSVAHELADRTFVVRGTGVHAGESSSKEEDLAEELGAEKCIDTGTFSWWELPLHIHGWRFLFKHHPPTKGQLPHTRPPAVVRCAKITFDEYTLRGRVAPHFAVFSHIHHFGDSFTAYPTRALVTGSWQFRTAYVHSRLPLAQSEIGGFIIVVRPEHYPDVRRIEYTPKETTPWVE